jgi:hypothetical protein
MEIAHVLHFSSPHVASAWNTLRRLSAANSWFWLVRSAPLGGFAAKIIESGFAAKIIEIGFAAKIIEIGAFAPWTSPAICLVLLHELPRLLGTLGAGAASHG